MINGATWESLKGNKDAASYEDLSEADQITFIALTQIQNDEDAAGRGFADPSTNWLRKFTATVTTYTRTGPIGDGTQVLPDATWAQYKASVDPMQADFQSNSNYLALDTNTQALVDALILA